MRPPRRSPSASPSSPRGTPAGLPAPRKRFGQHFLRDARVLDAIVEALGPLEATTVVEIGPGRGVLTDRLAERAARLVAIELDRDLAQHLAERYAARAGVSIVNADVLKVSLGALAAGPYRLVGNVPYYITTPILFQALEAPRAEVAVFLVQKEVADRLTAPPGTKAYGALGVNIQAVAEVELVVRVPPGAFYPPPQVDSAVVRLRPRAEPVVTPEEEAGYRRFVQAAFGMRRKQLGRVLRSVAGLSADEAEAVVRGCGLDPQARPEVLSPEAFARVVRALRARPRA